MCPKFILMVKRSLLLIQTSTWDLGDFISTNIADRNITENVCDLYKRSNWIISDFRVCDSSTLDSLHSTYCMHMYGCELWDLNSKYVSEFKVAWRKIKRRICVASLQKGPHVAKIKKLRFLLILVEQVMTNLLKKISVLTQIFTKLWSIYELHNYIILIIIPNIII